MADVDKVTEKVYCYDHPSAYCGNNHDALAAMAMGNMRNNNDPLAMMAMMGGGMNGQWNNPFIYLVWMMMAQRMWNNNGCDQNSAQFQELQNQLTSLRTQMQDNQNSNMIMGAVKGIDVNLGQLAQNLNCDFNALQGAICDVRGGIDRLAGQVGFSAERIINQGMMGDMNIITQLKDCCCSTKELIQRMGYESQLAQKDIITGQKEIGWGITKTGCDITSEMQKLFQYTNTGIERGFSAIGFQAEKDKCEIINAINASQQRTADLLNLHWKEEMAAKLQKVENENSQLKQNIFMYNLYSGNGCGCGAGMNNQ